MYIDPNTGGILFQALAAVLAVVSGLLLIFRRGRNEDEEQDNK